MPLLVSKVTESCALECRPSNARKQEGLIPLDRHSQRCAELLTAQRIFNRRPLGGQRKGLSHGQCGLKANGLRASRHRCESNRKIRRAFCWCPPLVTMLMEAPLAPPNSAE